MNMEEKLKRLLQDNSKGHLIDYLIRVSPKEAKTMAKTFYLIFHTWHEISEDKCMPEIIEYLNNKAIGR